MLTGSLKRGLLSAALVAGIGAAPVIDAWAQVLTIGRGNEPQSIDPQFSRTGPNQMTAIHVFDRLLISDENVRMHPGLAESWELEDETTWLVHLRPGVRFHDGSPFTAEDVVFSMERAPNVPNSPASFGESVSAIERMEIVDDLTIRFYTNRPDPEFMSNIGTVYIVSKALVEGASSDDFNRGTVAIGTGPYRYVSWDPGDRLILERNEDYWGGMPEFERVVMRFISNDAARVAALLSGSVDVIDLVNPADLPRLRAEPGIEVFEDATARLVYLALNQNDTVPHLTSANGGALSENPLQDPRVRRAISLMIDRNGLTQFILQGSGVPTAQLVPEGIFGYAPSIEVPAADRDAAWALLAEAGYPDGFGITIHGSGDRFLLDGEVTQAIGQMLARAGMTVNGVETLPYSVFAPGAGNGEYAAFLFSYGNSTGEAGRGLSSLFHSYAPEINLGTLNRFRYSSAEFDDLVYEALSEFDWPRREELLQQSTELALLHDTAIIPLYHQSLAWAARTGLRVVPRKDERTVAMSIHIVE